MLLVFRTHQTFIPITEPLLPPLFAQIVEGCEDTRPGLAWMRTRSEVTLADYQSAIRRIRQLN